MSTHLWLASLTHDLSRQCLAGATVGLLSHILYFIRGYHDTQTLGIIIAHIAGYTTLLVLSNLSTATLIFASYLSTLFTSITIYRLFFHRLRRFPGPLAAKITRLYGPYTNRHGRMHQEQTALFQKYGDIVRIGPNELYIRSSDAIQTIHAAKSGCRKRNAGVYNVVTFKGEPNLDSILDREEHRYRRQVWERAMTTKALAGYENTTRQTCHRWVKKISEFNGAPINTSLFALLVSFENMGLIGFSHEFGTLEAGKEDRMLKLLETMFGQLAQLGELVWPVAVMNSLGIGGGEFDALAMKMADRRLALSPDTESSDIFGHLLKDFRSEKPIAYFNKNIVYSESGFTMIAGTDTIAVVLSYVLYHLAEFPGYQTRLFDEVAAVLGKTQPGEFVNSDLVNIELLDAVINETLRLYNPVCNNAARTTPPEGIVLSDGTWIPGDCSVRVPGYSQQRSEKSFVHPDDFIPERWTTRPELILERAAFMPFLVGMYLTHCVFRLE